MPVELAQLQAIFNGALAKSTRAERAAFLVQACGSDSELRQRIERLLAAHENAGSFMAPPDADPTFDSGATLREVPGSKIGRYKLLEQIGEGGFGVVFMAEQEHPIHRRVALKIIKLGMDTKQVVARFEAERKALAMMEHPNIAKVFDAGATETGRPYFVMEPVKGVPITTYCDENHLAPDERLQLFATVCHAVQHAHQKGIVHRDIKPTNVLVSRHDERPVVKVIDFGIAKATNSKLTEKTVFTESRQMIGTPAYMSPEQAGQSDLDIDTRSDIYSLGVLLYELLTGTTPFDSKRLQSAAYGEIQRIIREVEPPKPSTRLEEATKRSRLAGNDATMGGRSIASIAANRQIEPRRLLSLVRGELDWIVMKCLEKDRTRRYESAAALATDVLHHLADEPVTAGKPSRGYQLRKFVRRNRGPVLAGTALVLVLIAGVIGTTIGLIGQSRQRAIAEQQRSEAQRQHASAIHNLAIVLSAEDKIADLVDAETLLREAIRDPATSDPLEAAWYRSMLAHVLFDERRPVEMRKPDEGYQLYREAIEIYRGHLPASQARLARVLRDVGVARLNERQLPEAEFSLRESVQMYRGNVPFDGEFFARVLQLLGSVLLEEGKWVDADIFTREALGVLRQMNAREDFWLVFGSHAQLGAILTRLGQLHEAETELLAAASHCEQSVWLYRLLPDCFVELYTALDRAHPGKGYDIKACDWTIRFSPPVGTQVRTPTTTPTSHSAPTDSRP